jgi:rhodanese-related sulfurtransferase
MILTGSILLATVALLVIVSLRRAGEYPVVESGAGDAVREKIPRGDPRWRELESAGAHRLIEREKPRILDVRTPGEAFWGVIPGALLIPVQELHARVLELPKDDRPLLVYCAHGIRSASACEFLDREDYANVYNLAGGIAAWPHPLERP